MSPDTAIEEAGLSRRALAGVRRAATRRNFRVATLADAAKLLSTAVMDITNFGDKSLDNLREVLLKAGLYLADDTPGLWKSDREHYTALFVSRTGADPAVVVRLLCDHMTTAQLAAAAAKVAGEGERDDAERENARDTQGPGVTGEGRDQDGHGQEG